MTTIVLEPTDTVFFRDGRPYNQDDPTQAEAASVFPPYPPTVAGAVRAAAARAMGWNGGAWNDQIKATLGDGVDWQKGDAQLGKLRFCGPYVVKDGKRLFPAPLCLLQGAGENDFDQLAPGDEIECELGKVRLPAMPDSPDGKGWKVLGQAWLTVEGMTRVLNGDAPGKSEVFKAAALWESEPHIGIQRLTDTRTTGRIKASNGEPEKGALFAATHVRLQKNVALAIDVIGLPPDKPLGGNLAPLGGEGRSAWIKKQDGNVDLPEAPKLRAEDGKRRYTVCLVTPADLGDAWPGPGGSIAGSDGKALPGRIVSACTGRAVAVGGWDGAARRPLPLRPLVPAGSIWFLEAEASEAKAVQEWHGKAIGKATGWGFGRVLIGQWAPAKGKK